MDLATFMFVAYWNRIVCLGGDDLVVLWWVANVPEGKGLCWECRILNVGLRIVHAPPDNYTAVLPCASIARLCFICCLPSRGPLLRGLTIIPYYLLNRNPKTSPKSSLLRHTAESSTTTLTFTLYPSTAPFFFPSFCKSFTQPVPNSSVPISCILT